MPSQLLDTNKNNGLKDKDWVRSSFLLPAKHKVNNRGGDDEWLYFTTAYHKFTNTSPGGSFFINPPPQYTIFADIPRGGLAGWANTSSVESVFKHGMGRYYSESIDDWSNKVSFRFGMPHYKGLITFFTGFYDGSAAILGRTGRMGESMFYLAGKLVGTILALPLSILIWVGEAVEWLVGRPSSRYYNLKPAMPLYWQRVNLIANTIAANMGLISPTTADDIKDADMQARIKELDPRANKRDGLGTYTWNQLRTSFPGLFQSSGGIDVYYVANMSTRAAHHYNKLIKDMSLKAGYGDLKQQMNDIISNSTFKDHAVPHETFAKHIRKYHQNKLGMRWFTDGDGTKIDLTEDILTENINDRMKRSAADTTDGTGQQAGTEATGTNNTSETTNNATNPNQTSTSSTTAGNNGSLSTTSGSGSSADTNPTTSGTGLGDAMLNANITADDDAAKAQALIKQSQKDNLIYSILVDRNFQDETGVKSDNTPKNAPQAQEQGGTGSFFSGLITALTGGGTSSSAGPQNVAKNSTDATEQQKATAGEYTPTDPDTHVLDREKSGWFNEFGNYARDMMNDGGEWINFRVDSVKNVSESFTNNTAPSEIQGRINGASSTASELRFSLSDFQTGFGALDAVVNGIRDTMTGLADGLHLSGLATLMGAGFVDIPERWTDSTASLPSASYTIKCRPVYGNDLCRFLTMLMPYSCLLAGVLPISYGRQAYGAPFICEMYMQGKNQSRLAMITSLSISRGEGNLGWNKENAFLGCDISFEVKDLTGIMHAPIDSGLTAMMSWRWLVDDESVFNDYMAVLSNLSTAQQTYNWEKLNMSFARWKVVNNNFLSPGHVASSLMSGNIGWGVRKLLGNQNPSIQ